MRVLVLAAHPDDELLGVGGTVLRHRAAGDEVYVHVLHTCRIEPPKGVAWHRIPQGDDAKASVEEAVAVVAPDVVYTHHSGDLNADHRRLHESVLVACRPQSGVRTIRTFHTPSSTEWGLADFRPSLFVDITDHLETKLEALEAAYGTEMRPAPHPRSEVVLRAHAAFWGSVVDVAAAEPFMVVRDRW